MPEKDCIKYTFLLMHDLIDMYPKSRFGMDIRSEIYGPMIMPFAFPFDYDGKKIYSLHIGYPTDMNKQGKPSTITASLSDVNGDLCGLPFVFGNKENQSSMEVNSDLLAKIDELLAISQKQKEKLIKMQKQEEEEQKKKSDEINASSRARTDYFREPKPESWYPCAEGAFEIVPKQSQREKKREKKKNN